MRRNGTPATTEQTTTTTTATAPTTTDHYRNNLYRDNIDDNDSTFNGGLGNPHGNFIRAGNSVRDRHKRRYDHEKNKNGRRKKPQRDYQRLYNPCSEILLDDKLVKTERHCRRINLCEKHAHGGSIDSHRALFANNAICVFSVDSAVIM